jgi:hypothetical protein
MLFSSIAYIGADLTPGKKSIHYAALGPDLELLARGQGDLKALLTFLSGQQQAVLAIHGPARPNQQILTDAGRREQYLIPMRKGRPGNMRVAEYTLRQQRLPSPQTPAQTADAPQWMRESFKLTKQLEKSGYKAWQPGADHPHQFLEALPEHGFLAWLADDAPGGVLLPAGSLHGRMQRQMLLYRLDLPVPDPMNYFEEITRFRILQGATPQDIILPAPALASLAAAFMARQAAREPEFLTLLGIPQEGQIAVPQALLDEDLD